MTIVHVDMDAFYASVEELDNPDLKGKPVIVGGPSRARGVVSTANYVARKFGVKSAMPMITATQLCPDAVLVYPRHQRYMEVSRQIRAIFEHYTPLVEPLSSDEAFLDLNSGVKLFGSVIDQARAIKKQIYQQLGLSASVGIAPNKFLAKIASDLDKPDGFVIIEPENIQSFLDPLPITRLWGVGKSSAQKLEQQGIYQVADLRKKTLKQLHNLFGPVYSRHLWNLARGIDDRKVTTGSKIKSISKETTFETDLHDMAEIKRIFMLLTETVCHRLRQKSLLAKTVHIKYRLKSFKTFTRSTSLITATDQTDIIWQTVNQLNQTNIKKNIMPLRLIGVGVSNFTHPDAIQTDLFQSSQRRVDPLVDEINEKFGHAAISLARGITKTPKKADK